MQALLLLLLAISLAGCNPYVLAASAVSQTYSIATDVRSVSSQAADTGIETSVKAALLSSPVHGSGSLNVFCRQGVVVLAGVVPRRSSAGFAAVRIARETSGVRRIETFFVHSQPDPMTDFGIKEKIKATLITDPRLIAGQVDLGVYAGHVVLVGVVDSWEKVEEFREAVRSVDGVLSVRSYIQVLTT
ncbi:MAG: BON domain-containing protein [Candidatus Rokuibacteriota bacterium]